MIPVSCLCYWSFRSFLCLNKTGWCAFEDFVQLLLIYLFDCRFRWMINSNALESSKENSLIVMNVIDTMSKHSVAQAQPLRALNSLRTLRTLFLNSFLSAQRKTFIPSLFSPPMSNRCSSPIRIAWQQEQSDANITSRQFMTKGFLPNLFTCE